MSRASLPLLATLLTACGRVSDPAEAPGPDSSVVRDGVAYSAEVRVLESFPVQLRGSLRMENTTPNTVRLELGSGCPVLLRAYRTAERRTPVWDQGSGLACTLQIQIRSLAPGGVANEDAPPTDAAEILGDSLPAGTYHLSAYVRVNAGTLELPAGSAELAVPR